MVFSFAALLTSVLRWGLDYIVGVPSSASQACRLVTSIAALAEDVCFRGDSPRQSLPRAFMTALAQGPAVLITQYATEQFSRASFLAPWGLPAPTCPYCGEFGSVGKSNRSATSDEARWTCVVHRDVSAMESRPEWLQDVGGGAGVRVFSTPFPVPCRRLVWVGCAMEPCLPPHV